MFNRLKKLFGYSVTNAGAISELFEYAPSNNIAGVPVNETTILSNAFVFRAVNLLSAKVACLDLAAYKQSKDGKEPDERHPATWVLRHQPSQLYGPALWRKCVMFHKLVYGAHFSYIIRDELGKPSELLILDPRSTWLNTTNPDNLVFETIINDKQFRLAWEDVIYVRGLSLTGVDSYSPVKLLKDQFSMGLAVRNYVGAYYKNSCRPGMIIELPAQFQDAKNLKIFREEWYATHNGSANSHMPSVVPPGTKVTVLPSDNEKTQSVELIQEDGRAISNIFGIPGNFLNLNIATSYNSLVENTRSFLSDSLGEHLTVIEDELSAKLLTERQKYTLSHCVEFNRKQLIENDPKVEVELLIKQKEAGLLSWQECRRILNKPTDRSTDTWDDQKPEPQPTPDQPPADSAPDTQPKEDEKYQLKELLKITLNRLVNRVTKSLEDSPNVLQHKEIWLENLKPFNAEGKVTALLNQWHDEAQQVLKEQRKYILDRVNTEELADQILSA